MSFGTWGFESPFQHQVRRLAQGAARSYTPRSCPQIRDAGSARYRQPLPFPVLPSMELDELLCLMAASLLIPVANKEDGDVQDEDIREALTTAEKIWETRFEL